MRLRGRYPRFCVILIAVATLVVGASAQESKLVMRWECARHVVLCGDHVVATRCYSWKYFQAPHGQATTARMQDRTRLRSCHYSAACQLRYLCTCVTSYLPVCNSAATVLTYAGAKGNSYASRGNPPAEEEPGESVYQVQAV